VSGPPRRGIPFVVAAPSGTGKTTVCRAVVARDPQIAFSVSHTTRPQRPGERDGEDYHFVTPEIFERMIAEQAFLEWAEYNGNRYGTSWRALEAPLADGRDLLLEIEIQGARQVRGRRPDARFIFLLPPSMEALEARLRGRSTESEAQIAARVALAHQEVEAVAEFHYAVVNDELERCVAAVLELIAGERCGRTGELRRRYHPEQALARLREPRDSSRRRPGLR
jgi:guanylate kinase